MADDVYISGLGGGVPEWANESTQQRLLQTLSSGMSQNTAANQQILSMLKRIANGEKVQQSHLRGAIQQLKAQNSLQQQNIKANQRQEGTAQRTLSVFGQFIKLGREQLNLQRKQLDVSKRSASLQKGGLSKGLADVTAKLESKKESLDVFSFFLKKAGAAAAALKGIADAGENFVVGSATERFNLAQEMRQSGLLSGLDSASAGLINLSKSISNSNFTFGEAAKFTRDFSQAVGVMGVKASLDFANSMASADGGDMARRFGLRFEEVTDFAGTYLESLRNIGMLDKLSNAEMKQGMETFMDTVVSTSNVMKINMSDSAKLILAALQKDQVTAFAATGGGAETQALVAQAATLGNNELSQILQTMMAVGSEERFAVTGEAMSLRSSPILRTLEQPLKEIAQIGRTQGPEALAKAMETILKPAIADSMTYAGEGQIQTLMAMDTNLQRQVAELSEIGVQMRDINKGITAPSDAGAEVLKREELTRQEAITQEGLVTAALDKANIDVLMAQINNAQATLLKGFKDIAAVSIDTYSSVLESLVSTSNSLKADAGAAMSNIANTIGDPAKAMEGLGLEPLDTSINNLKAAIEKNTIALGAKAGINIAETISDDYGLLDKGGIKLIQGVVQATDAVANLFGADVDNSSKVPGFFNDPKVKEIATLGRVKAPEIEIPSSIENRLESIKTMKPEEMTKIANELMSSASAGKDAQLEVLKQLKDELINDKRAASRPGPGAKNVSEIQDAISAINELVKTLKRN